MTPRDFIAALLNHLNENLTLPVGWDSNLPNYCTVQLDSTTEFVAAQCRGGRSYVISLISLDDTDRVRSVLALDYSAKAIQSVAKNLQLKNEAGRHPAAADSETGSAQGPASTNSRSVGQSAMHQQPLPNRQRHSSQDPNAPPGFEDEYRLVHSPSQGPHIFFDPDQDLNPPGGPNPRLGPLGPNPLLQDHNNRGIGGIPGPVGGMHPELVRSGRRPGVRYDPTSPFDPYPPEGSSSSNSFGSGFNGFDSPF